MRFVSSDTVRRVGLFGERGLRKLGREAATLRQIVEAQVSESQDGIEPSGPISKEDMARLVAGSVRDMLQEQGAKGKDAEALDCLQEAFQGASPEVRSVADEVLVVSEPLLAAGGGAQP
jgi:hypothetical protein